MMLPRAGLSRITHRLTKLAGIRGKGAFRPGESRWLEVHTQDFEKAKHAIANSSLRLLSFIDYDQPLFVRSDACDIGCGGVLFQRINGRETPVAFYSKNFTAQLRNEDGALSSRRPLP